MKRDIIGDIFLGGVLLSLLFIFSFPVYFAWEGVVARPIELNERLMGVCYLMMWILVAIWACWKKKVWVIAGSAFFGLLAYLPKWFLPIVEERIHEGGSSFLDSFLSMLLNRIYELIHAPFVGTVGILGEKTAQKLPEVLFPAFILAYILVQIVRYYRNAYITEKKQMHDWAHFRKNTEARMATAATVAGEQPATPLPLGTVVMNEKAEVEQAVFPGREIGTPNVDDMTAVANLNHEDATKKVSDATMQAIPVPKPEDAARIEDTGTKVVELPAHAATSRPAEEGDTKAIELPAHAPTSVVSEGADEGDTKAIPLPARAPTSREQTPPVPQQVPEPPQSEPEDVLDFPDVRGEAEKIDVFGDSDLD